MSEPNLTVRADPTGSVASVASVASADPAGVVEAASVATGWDCHVHVFDAAAPVRPGHYRPDHHPLEEIEALALAHGIPASVTTAIISPDTARATSSTATRRSAPSA